MAHSLPLLSPRTGVYLSARIDHGNRHFEAHAPLSSHLVGIIRHVAVQAQNSMTTPCHQDADLTDDMLVERARTDPGAFADLYERYRPSIYGYVLRRLGDPHRAEDVTSQVFLRALRGLPTFQSGSFRGWIYQIARNTITDSFRRTRVTTSEEALSSHPDPDPGPMELAERREAREQFHRILDQLPGTQGEIIRLRLDGLTGQEIADVLNMTLSAVKSAQYRAFDRIRNLMGEHSPGSSVPKPPRSRGPGW